MTPLALLTPLPEEATAEMPPPGNAGRRSTSQSADPRPLGMRRIPRREILDFCFQLEQLTRAGLPLLDGLEDIGKNIEHPAFRAIVSETARDIAGGQTLAQALAQHPAAFDAVFVSLVSAGERCGRLPEILANQAETLKWQDELAAQNQKILFYPAFVALVLGGATIFLMLNVVPQLRQFAQTMGQPLPAHARLLFLVAEGLGRYWPILAAGTASILGASSWLIRRRPSLRLRFDALKLRLPVLGKLIEKNLMARFANTLAQLYGAGIPFIEAIATGLNVIDNQAMRQALQQVAANIAQGSGIAEAFRQTQRCPPLIARMLHLGEQTGDLERALRNVAYFYERDVREGTLRLQGMIEPMLTAFMGLLLGWVMLSVIGPIYDTIAQIRP